MAAALLGWAGQEPMVVWDAQQDARYDAAVDSAQNSVEHGATIACVPLVDERWQGCSAAQPHVIGVLQLVVQGGRKKRLGLELRALLVVVRPDGEPSRTLLNPIKTRIEIQMLSVSY
jgi:hypothetical protein